MLHQRVFATSSASTLRSASCSAVMRDFHVIDFPFPCSHSDRIWFTILTGSCRHLCSIFVTIQPVLSLRRNVPKLKYLVPTFWGIWRCSRSGSVGGGGSGCGAIEKK